MKTLLQSLPLLNKIWLSGSQGWVGMDVGCHEIRLAQIEEIGGQMTLNQSWSFVYPSTINKTRLNATIHGNSIVDERFAWLPTEHLTEHGLGSVQNGLRQLHRIFAGHLCAVTLNDGLMAYREVELPRGSEDEMRAMAQSEVLLDTSIEESELLTECWELVNANNGIRANAVLGTASLSSIVSNRIATSLLDADWECRVLDSVPCSLARSVTLLPDYDPNESVLSVDIGYAQTVILLSVAGQPGMMRCLRNVGLRSLIETVAEAFQITMADALLLLMHGESKEDSSSDTTENGEQPLDAFLTPFVANLYNEIDRTNYYIERSDGALFPNRIVLSGAALESRSISRALLNDHEGSLQCWGMRTEQEMSQERLAPFAISAGLSAIRWEGA